MNDTLPTSNWDTPAAGAPGGTEISSASDEKVEAPLLPAGAGNVEPFLESMKTDPTIKRYGKFHIGPHTFWWAVSSLGFGSTLVPDDSPDALEVTRRTFLEVSSVREGLRLLHRVIIGRLIVTHSRR